MGAPADIAQEFMAMVRAERDIPIRPAPRATPALFPNEPGDQCHHIGIAFEVGRFVERAVRVLADFAQMGEMDAIGETPLSQAPPAKPPQ